LLLFPKYISSQVTVFDFSTILERTERRVKDDLLGAGAKTVDELKSIAGRLRVKYQNQLDRRIQRAEQQQQQSDSGGGGGIGIVPPPQIKGVMDKATNMAGGFFAKMKNPGFINNFNTRKESDTKPAAAADPEPAPTIVDLPPLLAATIPSPPNSMDGDWAGTDIAPATDAISNFSIGDDEEEDEIL
jgi:hypothetical protein